MKQTLRVLALLGLISGQPLLAQQAPTGTETTASVPQAAPSEAELAAQAAQEAMQMGPITIKIAQQAELKVPEGYGHIPRREAQRLLEAWGNGKDNQVEGMLVSTTDNNANWFLVVSWDDTGYIKDDDAKTWDPAEMLQSMKEGTEQMNEERKERGIPAIHVKEWAEVPKYDEKTHRLVWSLIATGDGETDLQQATINYNTVMLGREGKISMNMVTSVAELPALRPIANTMLGNLEFVAGKTYADFNPESDHVAEYGLAALVAGGIAKKMGLLALAAAFFAKFAKLIIAGFLAVGYGIKTLLGRKKSEPNA